MVLIHTQHYTNRSYPTFWDLLTAVLEYFRHLSTAEQQQQPEQQQRTAVELEGETKKKEM